MKKISSKTLKSQKGIAHIFILLLVLVTIGLVVWLIKRPTNLIPHADEIVQKSDPAQFVNNELLIKFNKATADSLSSEASAASDNQVDFTHPSLVNDKSGFADFAQSNQIKTVEPLYSGEQFQADSETQSTNPDISRWFIVRLDRGGGNINKDTSEYNDLKAVADKIRTLSGVEDVDLNGIVTASFIPDDPLLPGQLNLPVIKAQEAWDISQSSSDVNIAIVDTGIDETHPDLSGKVVSQVNFSNSLNGAKDFYGHGTHVAGIAAAVTNNKLGIAGVAPKASLMNVKVLNDAGSAPLSTVAQGIVWAADNNASVINMSLGLNGDCKAVMQDPVNYAWNKGSVIVAAAGNSSNTITDTPGNCNHVISVAATKNDDTKADFSAYGPAVTVAAPGFSVLSTRFSDYSRLSGTSMSSPTVAGLAALMRSANPALSNGAINLIIEATADKISGTGPFWKYGRINALSAVQTAKNAISPIFLIAEGQCSNGVPVISLDFNDIAPGGTGDLSVKYIAETTPNVYRNIPLFGKLSLRPLLLEPSTVNVVAGVTYQIRIHSDSGITSNMVSVTAPNNCVPDPTPLPSPEVPSSQPSPTRVIDSLTSDQPRIAWYAYNTQAEETVPVYEIYRKDNGNIHFFTADKNEADGLVSTGDWFYQKKPGRGEGGIVAWYAYSTQKEGTVPVYEIYRKDNTNIHFFTADKSESDGLIATGDWIYQRIAWYTYDSRVSSTIPVYNIYLKANGNLHFYTTDIAERDGLLKSNDWAQ